MSEVPDPSPPDASSPPPPAKGRAGPGSTIFALGFLLFWLGSLACCTASSGWKSEFVFPVIALAGIGLQTAGMIGTIRAARTANSGCLLFFMGFSILAALGFALLLLALAHLVLH